MPSNSLFISDLHLAPERSGIISLFERFVDEIAVHADRLYILGDFLEYWIGDDDRATGLDPVFAALDRLHEAGTRVMLMHGNRDFLIGSRLSRRFHFEIIDDPCAVTLNGRTALLMHGDLLCTDDIAYQKFRRKMRNRALQRLFLMLPLSLRERIARSLRGTSEKATAYKSVYQQRGARGFHCFLYGLLVYVHDLFGLVGSGFLARAAQGPGNAFP